MATSGVGVSGTRVESFASHFLSRSPLLTPPFRTIKYALERLRNKASRRPRTDASYRLPAHVLLTIQMRQRSSADGHPASLSRFTIADLSGDGKDVADANKDLLTLGRVMMTLSSQQQQQQQQRSTAVVPYRDTKLTTLLQDAFGGNCRTLLMACVSSKPQDASETLNTLRYAAMAQQIRNYPTAINTVDEKLDATRMTYLEQRVSDLEKLAVVCSSTTFLLVLLFL